jgi:signal transduction histidine kinase
VLSEKKSHKRVWLDVSYISVILAAIGTVFVVVLVYRTTQNILKERLRERLIAIASTASLQFDPADFEKIQDEDDLESNELKKITEIMSAIREKNENLQYIYLLRPTSNPHIQYFIADADTLGSLEELDADGNGVLDETENPPYPGDEYDSSELPALAETLNGTPTADYDLTTDQWGTFLSGYAPIFDEQGSVVAILGIDVEVSDFNILVRETLIPFIALSAFLLGTLIVLTIILTHIWRNRVEIVKELDRQKDELLGIVSHQLATPVSSIKWYTEMMVDGDLGKITKDQKEHLKSMQGISSNLADLVSMILDVSRIQLGRIKVEKQELDLKTFFKEIIEIIEPKAKEKSINFQKILPTDFPNAQLDKRYTHMTIENLLTNAIKYTPEKGTVILEVSVKGQSLFCSVKDTGVGIPEKDKEKIFGKLFRASNVRNTVDGNGFGLYVAKGAIEAQGGKIWFQSEENKGTTFNIELPLKDNAKK